MELSIPGESLKNFTRALTCLTRIGEDIDITATNTLLKMSTVNASRSAFGVLTFQSSFFGRYKLSGSASNAHIKTFSITGKALLSPLRSRSATTIQSCVIIMVDDATVGDFGRDCRLIVRLHCQLGVIKTHRLSYFASSLLHARASHDECSSKWQASSRILKDWTDHFHLRASQYSGGTDEISFYCGETSCRMRSFGFDPPKDDILLSRPMATELIIDVEDFDIFDISGSPLVTLALKELKAIIVLADYLSSPLQASFSSGGRPIIFDVMSEDNHLVAEFIIATTGYDSAAGGDNEVKKEREKDMVPNQSETSASRSNENKNETSIASAKSICCIDNATGRAGSSRPSVKLTFDEGRRSREGLSLKKTALFNPPSSQSLLSDRTRNNAAMETLEAVETNRDCKPIRQRLDENDGFEALDLGEEDFARIDRASQVFFPSSTPRDVNKSLLRPSPNASESNALLTAAPGSVLSFRQDFAANTIASEIGVDGEATDHYDETDSESVPSGLIPSQNTPERAKRKARWSLFPD